MIEQKRGNALTPEEVNEMEAQKRADELFAEARDGTSRHLEEEAVEASPELARKRDDYVPERFKPKLSENTSFAPSRAVPELVKWAAANLIAQLEPLTRGRSPHVRGARRRRGRLGPNSLVEFVRIDQKDDHDEYSSGFRQFSSEDEDAVLKAYKAWTGVDIKDTWQIVLAEELRAALILRQNERMFPEGRRIIDGDYTGKVVAPIRPPSAAQILERVRERCPPGEVPPLLNARVIQVGLDQTTDADRGGGRGKATKQSIEHWIAKLPKVIVKGHR